MFTGVWPLVACGKAGTAEAVGTAGAGADPIGAAAGDVAAGAE